MEKNTPDRLNFFVQLSFTKVQLTIISNCILFHKIIYNINRFVYLTGYFKVLRLYHVRSTRNKCKLFERIKIISINACKKNNQSRVLMSSPNQKRFSEVFLQPLIFVSVHFIFSSFGGQIALLFGLFHIHSFSSYYRHTDLPQ